MDLRGVTKLKGILNSLNQSDNLLFDAVKPANWKSLSDIQKEIEEKEQKEKATASKINGWQTPAHGNNYGWICPKCGRSNAPHVNSCQCYTYTMPYTPQPSMPWVIQPQDFWNRPIGDWKITCGGLSTDHDVKCNSVGGKINTVC